VTEDTAQRDVRHTEAAVHRCAFFDRMFDTAIACGLKFMLTAEEQRRLIHKVADVLVPGSRVLFTSCAGAEALGWNDAMAELQSRSLGAAEYRRQFAAVGLPVIRKYEGIGERPTRRRKGLAPSTIRRRFCVRRTNLRRGLAWPRSVFPRAAFSLVAVPSTRFLK
jgi:hypothetical protein